MRPSITVRGYTNVVLALNMKRFVSKEHQDRFERIRGTQEFAETLRNRWPGLAQAHGCFKTAQEEMQHRSVHDELTTEEIGFATGIFRAFVLEDLTFPTYALNKEMIHFDPELAANYQFKNLFQHTWDNWGIFIRPTFTGMFVVRLLREYNKPTSITRVAQDAIQLQESLDVQSARKQLVKIRENIAGNPQDVEKEQEKVKKFLAWLGADETTPTRLLYAPVQWKIAMEVCKYFVRDLEKSIVFDWPLAKGKRPDSFADIDLIVPEPSLSIPLHDSYIIYHLDEMWAPRKDDTQSMDKTQKFRMETVRPRQIRASKALQHKMAVLVEGSMLSRPNEKNNLKGAPKMKKYFPQLETELVEGIFDKNVASWDDELCLLTGRVAILMPSFKPQKDTLLIAAMPKATSNFPYVRYWGAIERMIEFVVEVRVLAQLLERASFNVLEKLAGIMDEIRTSLVLGDIRLHQDLPKLMKDAAHVRRLAALCLGLSNPYVWSRAEYATLKAKYLFEQLNVPQTLSHVESNISSINSMVDHVDEMYVADLSEQSNDMATLLSLGLAAASFVLTLLILPSFWADSLAYKWPDLIDWLRWVIYGFGTLLGVALIIVGAVITRLLFKYWKQFSRIMERSLERIKKTFTEGRATR
ncbi:MAG TPA: hypothetical protein VFG81_02970 [Anaerolineales bacterium]|nr:hypothetical protein [Anaerolineales bacterium]